ncbi:hypothetical protein [Actinomadura sp. 7K507]|uniref:hypothetical protein n=1 Tax=Actinomadura sp. 7K507 TaxID=2530365 RepID=UPI00104298A4|nr:hypothetical protein [Actinomadura sp. 7K507]TDC86880.1 hypothetical protein E1285_21880 [Actinomadura sp. 7K507]
MSAARRLRGAWAARRSSRPRGRSRGGRGALQSLLSKPSPEAVFLFGDAGPEAPEGGEHFSGEAQAWRLLADMEAARSRVWSRQGRVWDAGICAGRAQVYRAAAEQLERPPDRVTWPVGRQRAPGRPGRSRLKPTRAR